MKQIDGAGWQQWPGWWPTPPPASATAATPSMAMATATVSGLPTSSRVPGSGGPSPWPSTTRLPQDEERLRIVRETRRRLAQAAARAKEQGDGRYRTVPSSLPVENDIPKRETGYTEAASPVVEKSHITSAAAGDRDRGGTDRSEDVFSVEGGGDTSVGLPISTSPFRGRSSGVFGAVPFPPAAPTPAVAEASSLPRAPSAFSPVRSPRRPSMGGLSPNGSLPQRSSLQEPPRINGELPRGLSPLRPSPLRPSPQRPSPQRPLSHQPFPQQPFPQQSKSQPLQSHGKPSSSEDHLAKFADHADPLSAGAAVAETNALDTDTIAPVLTPIAERYPDRAELEETGGRASTPGSDPAGGVTAASLTGAADGRRRDSHDVDRWQEIHGGTGRSGVHVPRVQREQVRQKG